MGFTKRTRSFSWLAARLVVVCSLLLCSPSHALSSSSSNIQNDLTVNDSSTSSIASPKVRFRPGRPTDEWTIRRTLAQEFMNPLGIQHHRFLIASNAQDDSETWGWAQLKPLGSKQRDPNTYDASPGSYSVDQSIEEEIWDEFERDDSIEIPNGLASLPWTQEYKAAGEAAKKRREMWEKRRAQAEAESQKEENRLWELSSVYVRPSFRSNGIGSALIRRLLRAHLEDSSKRSVEDIYLVTLEKTQSWYERLGFTCVPQKEIPKQLQFEVMVGSVMTKGLGERLICMKGNTSAMLDS